VGLCSSHRRNTKRSKTWSGSHLLGKAARSRDNPKSRTVRNGTTRGASAGAGPVCRRIGSSGAGNRVRLPPLRPRRHAPPVQAIVLEQARIRHGPSAGRRRNCPNALCMASWQVACVSVALISRGEARSVVGRDRPSPLHRRFYAMRAALPRGRAMPTRRVERARIGRLPTNSIPPRLRVK